MHVHNPCWKDDDDSVGLQVSEDVYDKLAIT